MGVGTACSSGKVGVADADSMLEEIFADTSIDKQHGPVDVDALFGGMAAVNLFDVEHESEVRVGVEGIDFEAALDSGCVEHVCDDLDAPGYSVASSAGSTKGQHFIVGNGDKNSIRCEMALKIETDTDAGSSMFNSICQVANVTRP